MDLLVPALIAAGVLTAAVAYWRQSRRDARQRAEQAAADEFRDAHQGIVRSTL